MEKYFSVRHMWIQIGALCIMFFLNNPTPRLVKPIRADDIIELAIVRVKCLFAVVIVIFR